MVVTLTGSAIRDVVSCVAVAITAGVGYSPSKEATPGLILISFTVVVE